MRTLIADFEQTGEQAAFAATRAFAADTGAERR
jgi:hypothetical protein